MSDISKNESNSSYEVNNSADICISSEDIVAELNNVEEVLGFVNTIPWRDQAPYLDHSRTPWRDFSNGPGKI